MNETAKTDWKKGDRAILVHTSRSSVTETSCKAAVSWQWITITSWGRRQGTGTSVHGNLKVQLYPTHSILFRTFAEVEAYAAVAGPALAQDMKAGQLRCSDGWFKMVAEGTCVPNPGVFERATAKREAIRRIEPTWELREYVPFVYVSVPATA